MISIKNKFWMLVYAYKLLDLELIKTSSEKFTNVYDLLLHELNYFLERQIKKGLICSYQEMTEDLYSVKGRINISESLKYKMQSNNKLVCDYDEFLINNELNQIIKTAANYLFKNYHPEDKKEINKLVGLMRYFDEVDELDRKKIIWKNIRYNQNNKDYRILITIAYLILNIEIVANNGEELYFKDGTKINEKDLFEKFIREYYIFHYGDKLYVHKTNKEIKWTLTNLETTYLPNLYCDVYLKNKKNDNVLIIEVKCYAGGALENNDGVLKINSHNIRQIYTYVKNEDKDNTGKVKGLLLYAKADCDPDLNEKFTLDKNEFKVQNLDLSKDFDMVKATLNNIIDEFIM